MSASTSDLFMKLGSDASLVNSPKVTAVRSAGDTSLTVDTCNWDTTTGKVFATYQIDTSGKVVDGTQIIWKGVVTSTTALGSLERIAGASDTGNQISDIVELLPASKWANDLMDGILAEHNQDGTHSDITATSVSAGTIAGTTSVSEAGQTLQTLRSETQFDFIASGCVITADSAGSTLNYSMTSGVVYIGGKRVAVASFSAHAATASKDMYVDVDNTGTVTHTAVANNAASPALATSSIRLGIVVAGASNIAAATSINQGQETRVLPIASSTPYAVTDSLGNLICPRDPNRKILGYRQITGNFTTTSASVVQITGLSVPVIVPTNRKIAIKVKGQGFVSGNTMTFQLWDGTVGSGTQIDSTKCASTLIVPISMDSKTTPSSASKTYNLGVLIGAAATATVEAASTELWTVTVELV